MNGPPAKMVLVHNSGVHGLSSESGAFYEPAQQLSGDTVIVQEFITVHTSLLFDSGTKQFVKDYSIEVDPKTGLITKAWQRSSDAELTSTLNKKNTVDLRSYTVLPGLVDAHSHIFTHSYTVTPSVYQERDESLIERVVRATNHARTALLSGYTTYRDLGSEGLRDVDIGLRDAINRGITPGPRLFVVSEALASSGSYEIRHEAHLNGTIAPRIADPADGVAGCRAAVRRRIGAGADLIKFYADYRRRQLRFPVPNWPGALPIRFPPEDFKARNPGSTMWSQEEMDAIVDEARRARAPVAAHAQDAEAVIMAAKAGVTSIEHGFARSDEALKIMKEMGTIYCPTLSIIDQEKATVGEKFWTDAVEQVKTAHTMGISLAVGADTGAVAHGENVGEVEILVEKVGLPVEHVLSAATLGGWHACGGDWCGRRFGKLAEGWAADLIAIHGDPREDLRALRRVSLLMKDGEVLVEGGRLVADERRARLD